MTSATTAALPTPAGGTAPADGPPQGARMGLRRAALFLAQLSTEEAAALLAELRPREVEVLTAELVRLGAVATDEVDAVLAEARQQLQRAAFYGQGGEEFAREILAAGLGSAKAEEVLARLSATEPRVPFAALRGADVRELVRFLKDEHPQLIALVLAHLPARQSAEVLAAFPGGQQAEVAYRIAVTDRTAPETVRLVEEELARRMGSLLREDAAEVGGVAALVEIICRSPRPTERAILDGLDTSDPPLAEQVRAEMFVFDDIVLIDDRSLQEVLREVEAPDLALALKGVRADVQDKVFRNLSERVAENLSEEIDLLGPVRARTVEEAQGRVVAAIRALEQSGVLTVNRGEDELIL